MTVTINITLTDQAKEAFPDDPAESFLYQDGVPLQQAGDFVELASSSEPQSFLVIGRVFSLRQGTMHVNLVLDLPPQHG